MNEMNEMNETWLSACFPLGEGFRVLDLPIFQDFPLYPISLFFILNSFDPRKGRFRINRGKNHGVALGHFLLRGWGSVKFGEPLARSFEILAREFPHERIPESRFFAMGLLKSKSVFMRIAGRPHRAGKPKLHSEAQASYWS